jgi:hypothetical protein
MSQTNQPVVEDFKPSTLNQPGQQYPQVNSQRFARFRIVAPEAQSVSVGLGGRGGTPLAKAEDGSWMGTAARPLDEGFHYYHLTIDGGTFNDPGTLNFYGSTRWESGIEISAHDEDFYALKDVPHGRVQQVFFPSKFSHIGLFSGGTITTNDVNSAPGFREKVKVVFCSCGSRENAAGIRSNHEALDSIDIKNTAYVSPDTAHEFLTWRRSLHEFAPLLFQDQPLPPATAPKVAEASAAAPAPAATVSAAKTIRIKAGKSEPVKDAEGDVWLADQGFEGGQTIERPDIQIANTKSPDLYRAERYSMDSFSWPVPNGKFVVKLHFAETFEGITGPGQRLFSFNVQGREFKDFDVWAKAGGPLKAGRNGPRQRHHWRYQDYLHPERRKPTNQRD